MSAANQKHQVIIRAVVLERLILKFAECRWAQRLDC